MCDADRMECPFGPRPPMWDTTQADQASQTLHQGLDPDLPTQKPEHTSGSRCPPCPGLAAFAQDPVAFRFPASGLFAGRPVYLLTFWPP